VLKIVVLSCDSHFNKPLHVLKNTDQCLRRKSLEFFPNSESQLSGQVPWKRRFLNEEAEPEILIDQPIVKKLPPCCMDCNPVLLKILMSQFIIAENMTNVQYERFFDMLTLIAQSAATVV
jgi:hypothetical protein